MGNNVCRCYIALDCCLPCAGCSFASNKDDMNVFTMENEIYFVKVVDVYDGDTVKVVLKRRGEYQKHRVRLSRCDCAELKPNKRINKDEEILTARAQQISSSSPYNEEKSSVIYELTRDEEIQAAKAAKEALLSILPHDRMVYLKCGKFDKYGRLLGDIYISKNNCYSSCIPSGYCISVSDVLSSGMININDWMIANRYAIVYDGGTKNKITVNNIQLEFNQ